tara:strand:+ start:72259 stop:73218 length:960 start_codon:yes stop_codon:yes gene_type:complete
MLSKRLAGIGRRHDFGTGGTTCRRIVGFALVTMLMTKFAIQPAADEPISPPPQITTFIDEPSLRESSGLGSSRRMSDRFWSHNDSGGQPQLFAFDTSGRSTGRCKLVGASAVDWEDMACFRDETARILVADCGDNERRRSNITLYVFDEPDPDQVTNIHEYETIHVTYSDGPQDCEAVAVDAARRQIIMVAKTAFPFAGIYGIDLPRRNQIRGATSLARHVTAKRIGTLALPMVSAMDIDPHTGEIWVVNYFQCFRFPKERKTDPVGKQMAAIPVSLAAPKWKQIEALGLDEAQNVWLTSEGSPTPFGRLIQTQHNSKP